MTNYDGMQAWEARVAALWAEFDTLPAPAFLAAMASLAAERPQDDPHAAFELASAHDSIGQEAAAAPLYETALRLGLNPALRRQAAIQLASTLRNLGRPGEGLALLHAERNKGSDELDDALAAFEALMLADLGREREGLSRALCALAGHLPRYRRSAGNYAKALLTTVADFSDDDLFLFERDGAPELPDTAHTGHLHHNGARIWFASHGTGPVVVLLHGGLGHSGNWGHQIPELLAAGYQTLLIDSRGHGRSTRDDRPYSYQLMADDVLAILDHLSIDRAAFVGWSDGACIALVLADKAPERAKRVLFFACNVDDTGALPFVPTPAIERCFSRHGKDYAALSATPGDFNAFVDAVGTMQRTQPNYTSADLKRLTTPFTIVQAEYEEFIRPEHAQYLAATIPDADLITLPGVSHFAPLQRPAVFNAALLAFLARN